MSTKPQPGETLRVPTGTASPSTASTTELKFVPAVLTGVVLGERPAVVVRLPDGVVVVVDSVEHARAHDIGQLVACLQKILLATS